MRSVRKSILIDENNQPVAVQLSYRDWLAIESELAHKPGPAPDLASLYGAIKLREEPLAYQRRIRGR